MRKINRGLCFLLAAFLCAAPVSFTAFAQETTVPVQPVQPAARPVQPVQPTVRPTQPVQPVQPGSSRGSTSGSSGLLYGSRTGTGIQRRSTRNSRSGSENMTAASDRPVITDQTEPYEDKIVLKWKQVEGASGYEIFRSRKEKGTYTKIKTISGADTVEWTDENLEKGETYYYKIRAFRESDGKKTYGEFSDVYKRNVTDN